MVFPSGSVLKDYLALPFISILFFLPRSYFTMTLRRPRTLRPMPPTTADLDVNDHFHRLRPHLASVDAFINVINDVDALFDQAEQAACENNGAVPPDLASAIAARELIATTLRLPIEEALTAHLTRFPEDKHEHRATFELCLLICILSKDQERLKGPNAVAWAVESDLPTVRFLVLLLIGSA